jgi:hypothetical protein
MNIVLEDEIVFGFRLTILGLERQNWTIELILPINITDEPIENSMGIKISNMK